MSILTEQTVHLWFICHKAIKDEALLANYLSWLSDAERTRYQSIVCAQQGHQYLLTRALVRSVLSNYVPEIEPQAWLFTVNDYGKPELDQSHAHLNLNFNISHSMDLVVLALCSDVVIGVDVENIHRSVFSLTLAEHYFSVNEVNYLKTLPHSQQQAKIVEIWTLKEAYLKARGLGLRVPLKHFSFSLRREGEISVRFSKLLKDDESIWRLWLLQVGQDYRVALALPVQDRKHNYQVEINEWAPSSVPSNLDVCFLRKNQF